MPSDALVLTCTCQPALCCGETMVPLAPGQGSTLTYTSPVCACTCRAGRARGLPGWAHALCTPPPSLHQYSFLSKTRPQFATVIQIFREKSSGFLVSQQDCNLRVELLDLFMDSVWWRYKGHFVQIIDELWWCNARFRLFLFPPPANEPAAWLFSPRGVYCLCNK